MLDVASLVTTIGGLTVVTTLQQIATGLLDERRKNAQTKATARREPLVRRHLELDNQVEAETLAERRLKSLNREIERLEKKLEAKQAESDEKDAEILHQRSEIAQLYGELYKADPRRKPP